MVTQGATEGQEYVDLAEKSNVHLHSIIEKIILFAEARQGNLKLEEKVFNLRYAIEALGKQF